MAFGSMAPMPIPQMRQNNTMQQALQMMQMAKGMQGGGGPGGGQPAQPQQGLLQRLLNPAAPQGGAPTDLAAPGMQPNGNATPALPGFMQAGLLGKLLPQLIGKAPPGMQGIGGQMPPTAPTTGLY